MRKMVFVILFLLFLPTVYAKQGSIKLLALSELSDGAQAGTITDLSLEIKSGRERVFLETFPLAKIPTQISVRFAQQIACKELELECSKYDFFYTIKSMLGLVGGPSAGAAATLLTASLLSGEKLDETMTITGTINSGGLIGPVGGIRQKIDAASKNGIKTVLIPKGTRLWKEANKTIDLVKYGKNKSLDVVEVATFDEAFDKFTGKNSSKIKNDLVVVDKYKSVMKNVADDICKSVSSAERQIKSLVVNQTKSEQFVNISRTAMSAFKKGEFYTAASFCFRSSLLLRQISLVSKKPQRLKLLKQIKNASAELQSVVSALAGRKLHSMSDLQAYMAVDERLVEAKDSLDNAYKSLDNVLDAANYLAYAEERLNSAVAWGRFFDTGDVGFVIDNARLQQSCMNKISEAEERYSYVRSVIPVSLVDTRNEIDRAYADLSNQSFVMCLYRASKAKASSDVILSVLGVEESQLDSVLDLKLDVVRQEIVKSQKRGNFPIIGYSYYEYANSLRDVDKSSALLFAEYALELTNIDMYFERRNSRLLPFYFDSDVLLMFVFGFMLGVFAIDMYTRHTNKRRKK